MNMENWRRWISFVFHSHSQTKIFMLSPVPSHDYQFYHILKSTYIWHCCIQRIRHNLGATLVWLVSTVCFQMSPQTVCPRRGIVTLVAHVWLFSTVRFQMCPKSACIRGCKATLVAFVWLFSTVCFQMCPQMACLRRCIVALVALVWLFSSVCCQMCPQIACRGRGKITLVAFV